MVSLLLCFASSPRAPTLRASLLPSALIARVAVFSAGKHAFIGMGFTDRSHAFDFNAAIQDFRRELNAEKEAAAKPKDEGPKLDLTLKEGQTIKVKIGGAKGGGAKKKAPASAGDDLFGGLLAPPPVSAAAFQPRLRMGLALRKRRSWTGNSRLLCRVPTPACSVWHMLSRDAVLPGQPNVCGSECCSSCRS